VSAREAGLVVPLFALRSARGWGIGEIGDLGPLSAWLAAAGHRRLQLLPVFEMAPGERSPYAAITSFALDPIYLSLADVADFVASGGEAALSPEDRARLAGLRAGDAIDYDGVRGLKRRALNLAFAHFCAAEWRAGTPRAQALRAYCAAEADWLHDWALYRALKEERGEAPWTAWEPALRDRKPAALARARRALGARRLFHCYVQWLAAGQWEAARRQAAAAGVALDGDLAFMVSADSADVWVRQREFRLDASLGAPPDAFNASGQDWGLPVPRWAAMARRGFAWLEQRGARAAALFDGCRLDHVVGYYRMWVRPAAGAPAFEPATEDAQRTLGERLLGVIRAAAGKMAIVAEDLGAVPDFVRASLAGQGVPGLRVLRWEVEDGVFRDPRAYPELSVATSGTHDTSSLATWWSEELDDAGRRALAAVPVFAPLAGAGAFTPAVHAALLDGLYAAGSRLVLLPVQDAYGGRERINTPATVGPANWSYRLPWAIEGLTDEAGRSLAARLRALAARHGRLPAG
jgi:4-alpha-glucanotransferase